MDVLDCWGSSSSTIEYGTSIVPKLTNEDPASIWSKKREVATSTVGPQNWQIDMNSMSPNILMYKNIQGSKVRETRHPLFQP